MKIKMKLHGARNFILGMITMALIFTLIMSVSAQARTRNVTITYDNIRITIDGRETPLTDLQGRVIEPFLMDGTMFVPISPLVRQFGKTSTYDSSTRTLVIRSPSPTVRQIRTSLRQSAPFFDRGSTFIGASLTDRNIAFVDSINMGGTTYRDALRFGSANWNTNGNTLFTLHNLNRQYSVISGHLGRVDGTGMNNITVNFIGDGDLLQSYRLNATDMPIPINVNVAGVQQLRIEFVFPNLHGTQTDYALVAYIE